MLFMVIETWTDSPTEIYRQLRDDDRGLLDGLRYVDSWIDAGMSRCFQLMECDDVALVQQWVLAWHDKSRFEVVPVVSSADVRSWIAPL